MAAFNPGVAAFLSTLPPLPSLAPAPAAPRTLTKEQVDYCLAVLQQSKAFAAAKETAAAEALKEAHARQLKLQSKLGMLNPPTSAALQKEVGKNRDLVDMMEKMRRDFFNRVNPVFAKLAAFLKNKAENIAQEPIPYDTSFDGHAEYLSDYAELFEKWHLNNLWVEQAILTLHAINVTNSWNRMVARNRALQAEYDAGIQFLRQWQHNPGHSTITLEAARECLSCLERSRAGLSKRDQVRWLHAAFRLGEDNPLKGHYREMAARKGAHDILSIHLKSKLQDWMELQRNTEGSRLFLQSHEIAFLAHSKLREIPVYGAALERDVKGFYRIKWIREMIERKRQAEEQCKLEVDALQVTVNASSAACKDARKRARAVCEKYDNTDFLNAQSDLKAMEAGMGIFHAVLFKTDSQFGRSCVVKPRLAPSSAANGHSHATAAAQAVTTHGLTLLSDTALAGVGQAADK